MSAPRLSFEFFPPHTLDASFRLWETVHALQSLKPEHVSVTYGAGGTTRALTHEAVTTIGRKKGRGLIAAEIVSRAKEAGIYVHESPELVALLMQVDLDARIPPELYVAVAELLAWLYSLEQGIPMKTAPKSGAVTR